MVSRLLVVCLAVVCARPVAAQGPDCRVQGLERIAPAAGGVESVSVWTGYATVDIRFVRLPVDRWTLRVRDMRDLRQAKGRRGDYTSPTHSLAELAVIAPARILSSAGMTDSLYAPVPVGLLKVDGVVRSRANLSSRVLDGVLCAGADRRVSILSEVTSIGRRIPKNIEAASAPCVDAVQAGPMLVASAKSLVGTRGATNVARVFVALDRDGHLVLGHSPAATTFDLACVLSERGLSFDSALHLQSDVLGGVLFGKGSGVDAPHWGRIDGSLASALEVAPAGDRRRRTGR